MSETERIKDLLDMLVVEVMGMHRTMNIMREEMHRRVRVAQVVKRYDTYSVALQILAIHESPEGAVVEVQG